MKEILIAAGFGIFGGLTRLLVISLRTIQLKKQKTSYTNLFIYGLILIFTGAFSGIILSYGKILSFLGGYAALDLMDGYYKIFRNKKIKFK